MSQTRPLTFLSPYETPIHGHGEQFASPAWFFNSRRRRLICCLGCGSAIIVLLGLFFLIVALVFRIHNPTATLNLIDATNSSFNPSPNNSSENAIVSSEFTLAGNISVKNPNQVSFAYDSSKTEFYYNNITAGVGHVPHGKVRSDRTVGLNMTVEVFLERVSVKVEGTAVSYYFTSPVPVRLKSQTEMSGKASVLGIFKRRLDIFIECNVVLDLRLGLWNVTSSPCEGRTKRT